MLPSDVIPNALALLTETPVAQLVKDALVVGHLLALILGLSAVIKTDTSMLGRLRAPVTQMDFIRLHQAHHRIGYALIALWVTGLGLFLLRTGGDPSAASPKLAAKLLTVAWLSLTALMMSGFGVPTLGRYIGRPLLRIPLVPRLVLAVCAGMSVAGWGTALLLGASGTLLTAEWVALREVLLLTHLSAVAVLVLGACVAPLFLMRRRTEVTESEPEEPPRIMDAPLPLRRVA